MMSDLGRAAVKGYFECVEGFRWARRRGWRRAVMRTSAELKMGVGSSDAQ
jgi:hypothetical protein